VISLRDATFYPVENQISFKVGARTAKTRGEVQETCITVRPIDERLNNKVRFLCQHRTNMFSAGGDSGGPVFSNAGTNVRVLYGIHWGAVENATPPIEYFSPWGGIRRRTELGNMAVCSPEFTC
jgi:hypothetical protein